MRILLVDDEKDILSLLAQICEREGHEVSCAQSAAEALVALRVDPFDLLVTDIVMAGLDGLALVRRARVMQPELMAIVITAHAGDYTPEDVLEAGATDLILKPFRAPELRARLRIVAEQRRLVAQLKAQGRQLQATSAEMIEGLERELSEARQHSARLAAVIARGNDLV